MKKRRYNRFSIISNYVIFFLEASFIITVSILLYDALSSYYKGNQTMIGILAFLNIFVLCLILTGIEIIRKNILINKPTRKIIEATDKITSGDFNVKLVPRHSYRYYDELDIIMENINTMARELSKNEVLKLDFISNVSHELKTPLAIIQTYCKALEDDKLDSDTKKKYLDTLILTSKKLTNLITNILNLNKLENQEIITNKEVFNLGLTVGDVIVGFEELIEKKKLNLECEIDDVYIDSYPNYLDIVWNNLLSNAIKFTQSGGTIFVTVKKENDKAIVEIEDTGCGISKENGTKIFDKFYQADTSHSQEGNGLGLALVKKVIDKVGGEIKVSSKINVGTKFIVILDACEEE